MSRAPVSTPDPTRPESVQAMFTGIARRYDLLNHLLSFNQDKSWRRQTAARVAAHAPQRVLDLAAGTGDLALAVKQASPGAHVLLCDFTHAMLQLAPAKFNGKTGASFATADALHLPFADNQFDALTIGFGFRNFADRAAGLAECRRVLRPGGRLWILEFSQPEGVLFGPFYRLYLSRLLPLAGNLLSKSGLGAYGYLAKTVGDFPPRGVISQQIQTAGFQQVSALPMTLGIVALHTGEK